MNHYTVAIIVNSIDEGEFYRKELIESGLYTSKELVVIVPGVSYLRDLTFNATLDIHNTLFSNLTWAEEYKSHIYKDE